MKILKRVLTVLASVSAIGMVALRAQEAVSDVILFNGKIITVDDRFSIAQAVAVRGDRFVAVGTNQEIERLAGPTTRRIDLRGRAVTPGFIDHHGHYTREGDTWSEETRLEGIDTRKQAIEMLRARAVEKGPGAWVYTMMGWDEHQFTDDKRPFTRAELDQVAPNNPVGLHGNYYRFYLNSAAFKTLGIDDVAPDPEWMPAGAVVRDARGKPTGEILPDGVRPLANRLIGLPRTPAEVEASHLAMIGALNRAGLTSVGTGCPEDTLEMYRRFRARGQLNVRVFCQSGVPIGNAPDAMEKLGSQLLAFRSTFFQGDSYIDHVAYGEGLLGSDDMWVPKSDATPEFFARWGRAAREVAKAGLPLHVHTTLEGTFDGFLEQIERINREFPIRNLRWATFHSDQPTKAHLERMKNLGMYIGPHMRPPTVGGLLQKVHGDRIYDTPPLQWIRDSGIMWGVGTDFNMGPYNPFLSLAFMVTGKMVGGTVVNRQPISREDALIAHTRNNAFFVFQENNLGSIHAGKQADLVVLDRDYLTVPADQIKAVKSVLTMVGGRVVYEAAAAASSASR